MAIRDRSELARRAALRRPCYRFERGIRVRARGCDDKRWAWQNRVFRVYGLAAWDIALKWNEQEGKCPICEQPLSSKKWVIDHRHVVGWRKMPPAVKRRYFRGVLCTYCNHRVLGIVERAGWLRVGNIVRYLDWAIIPRGYAQAPGGDLIYVGNG